MASMSNLVCDCRIGYTHMRNSYQIYHKNHHYDTTTQDNIYFAMQLTSYTVDCIEKSALFQTV